MGCYYDGLSCTTVEVDLNGRVVIAGYDGELLVHHATYSRENAESIAAELMWAATDGQVRR